MINRNSFGPSNRLVDRTLHPDRGDCGGGGAYLFGDMVMYVDRRGVVVYDGMMWVVDVESG